jgi:hypothetical protein
MSSQLSPLGRWGRGRPRGWLTQLMYDTRLSWGTLCRANAGKMLNFRSATVLSAHTGIPVEELTDDPAAKTTKRHRARGRRAA